MRQHNTVPKGLRRHISFGSIRQLILNPRLWTKVPRYLLQLYGYREMERNLYTDVPRLRIYPSLDDDKITQEVGFYFYQDCWAAGQVFREKPAYVVDIGSTVLLVGILSQFTPCVSVDIRPIQAQLKGLSTRTGSALEMPFNDGEVPCVTTMCVLEHIGLGRYGDPLAPDGTKKAVQEIARVVSPGGIVVYSVPVGEELLEFNAHRRFTYHQSASLFSQWELVDSCVLDPKPAAYTSEDAVKSMRDPVACFCMRKPHSVFRDERGQNSK